MSFKNPAEFSTFEEYKQYINETVPDLQKQKVQVNTFALPVRKPNPLVRLSEELMDQKRVWLDFRDECVHHHLPLQECRAKNMFLPWHCDDERIRLERCYYKRTLSKTHKSTELWKLEQKMKKIDELISSTKEK